MPDKPYQALIRHHISLIHDPGSRLHAGSQTRTLHADTGRNRGPSDRGAERRGSERRGSSDRGPSDAHTAAGSMRPGPCSGAHEARAHDTLTLSPASTHANARPRAVPPLCRWGGRGRETRARRRSGRTGRPPRGRRGSDKGHLGDGQDGGDWDGDGRDDGDGGG